jgi:hypothetical protein
MKAILATTRSAETVDTRIGKLDFELGVPTQETVAKLYNEMDFQRACQLYLWALPIVNAAQATLWVEYAAGSHDGDAVIVEGYRNLSGVLTPNVINAVRRGICESRRSRSGGGGSARRPYRRVGDGFLAAAPQRLWRSRAGQG